MKMQESAPSLQKLDRGDIIYFLLALACSANIGSQITYTGNPQNMLLSQDAISVMPSYKFFIYMLLPSTTVWLISKFPLQLTIDFFHKIVRVNVFVAVGYIYRCWNFSKLERESSEYGDGEYGSEIKGNEDTDIELQQNTPSDSNAGNDTDKEERKAREEGVVDQEAAVAPSNSSKTSLSSKSLLVKDRIPELNLSLCACASDSNTSSNYKNSNSMSQQSTCNPIFSTLSVVSATSPMSSPRNRSSKQVTSPVMSPRKRRRKEREVLIGKVVYVVSSPFPYMVLILLAAMIMMIFVDVMPISALICVSAMCIVVTVVVGNHWRNKKVRKYYIFVVFN